MNEKQLQLEILKRDKQIQELYEEMINGQDDQTDSTDEQWKTD